jgi:hypothetical protein
MLWPLSTLAAHQTNSSPDSKASLPESVLDNCPTLDQVRAEIRRRALIHDPATWAHEVLGVHLWSKQREILASVQQHRHTAVHSCHEIGKSFIASVVAAHWIEAHHPGEAFVVTTAPTGPQVKAILWRELNRRHVAGKLRGRMNQTEWYLGNEIVAFGRKPADYNPAAFQGIHARYVLALGDEACGLPKELLDAMETLCANENSRVLLIGNPDDPGSEFAKACAPGSGWNVIGIGATDTPNFTGEEIPDSLKDLLISPTWVAERAKRWGVTSPLYVSKVLGKFPEAREDALIQPGWILAAQNRSLEAVGKKTLGVDVGAGGDKNVVCFSHGPVSRIIRENQEPDTMKSTGNVVADLESTGAEVANVDYIGVGRGVVDRGKEIKKPFNGVNVGAGARDNKGYRNLKAEAFWGLREIFQDGDIDIDPADDELAAQLGSLIWFRSSRGQTQIESKEDMKKRGLPSPDRADALMLSKIAPAAPPCAPPKRRSA